MSGAPNENLRIKKYIILSAPQRQLECVEYVAFQLGSVKIPFWQPETLFCKGFYHKKRE